MAGTASTTTITTGKCPKHAFAPRVFPSPPKPCSAHHISPRKRAFCPSHRLRHASDIPVAGDDPVNESDPSGLLGHGNPWLAECDSGHNSLGCFREEIAWDEGNPTSPPGSPPNIANKTVSGPVERIAPYSLSWPSPTLFIPGPLPIAIQDDVEYSGPKSTVDVELAADGSLDVGAGDSSAEFSSSGALESLAIKVPGLSWLSLSSSDDIVATATLGPKELPHDLGEVKVNITATLLTKDIKPPLAIEVSPAAIDGVATAVGSATTGVIIWWLAKLLSPACGPGAPVCAVAG
jgi:hypothetical protein